MAKKKITKEECMFTPSQQKAWNILCQGRNAFISGNAGSGKSFLINKYIEYCLEKELNIIVTAPTGIASQNIKNGITLHRAFKIPVPIDFSKEARPTKEIYAADVIVIDEISMCRCDVFDYIAECLRRKTKTSHRHQLIVVGDLYQLPPVINKNELPYLIQRYPNIMETKGYPFTSYSWGDFNFANIVLKEAKRQSDTIFLENLDKVRVGDISCIKYFDNRVIGKEVKKPSEDTLELVGTNSAAEIINNSKLKKIDSESKFYFATETGIVKSGDKVVSDKIELKVGARVMSMVNAHDITDYQNGSLGEIIGFANNLPKVRFDNGRVCIIDRYTWKILKPKSEIVDEKLNIVKVTNEVIGTYEQIPLKLAYAITMHKSQGQTYESAIIDPKAWESGQLYVALSRISKIDGMFLKSKINPNDLFASKIVKQYYADFKEASIENDQIDWIKISCPNFLVEKVNEFITEELNKNAILA